MNSPEKLFWVKKAPNLPTRFYADFFAAERYAIAALHARQGEETKIMHGPPDSASVVAYCRIEIKKTRKQAVTFISAKWSKAINASIERLEYKTKKSIKKNYKFIDSHLQIAMPL